MEFTNQELLESTLFYSRKERILQEKLKRLIEDIDNDVEELDLENIEFFDEEEL